VDAGQVAAERRLDGRVEGDAPSAAAEPADEIGEPDLGDAGGGHVYEPTLLQLDRKQPVVGPVRDVRVLQLATAISPRISLTLRIAGVS
jgi:hypothetical protein